jgi:hypothetical protein
LFFQNANTVILKVGAEGSGENSNELIKITPSLSVVLIRQVLATYTLPDSLWIGKWAQP